MITPEVDHDQAKAQEKVKVALEFSLCGLPLAVPKANCDTASYFKSLSTLLYQFLSQSPLIDVCLFSKLKRIITQ